MFSMNNMYHPGYPGANPPMFPESTKFNYLNQLREQFASFENEVWNYNSHRPNEAFKIDQRLPLTLIELFAKLFRLWRDFEAFQKLIKPELFHKINDDMNEYFGVSLNKFDLWCDVCDQAIAVQKNDLRYSYEMHSQDERHQTVLSQLDFLTCTTDSDTKADSVSSEAASDGMKDEFNGYIMITDNNRLKCTLCEKNLIDEQEAIHHVTSWPHRLKETHFSPDDEKYVVNIDGTYCCRLCRCRLSDCQQSHEDHLSSHKHQVLEECHRMLKENVTRVTVLNYDTGEFMCELCDRTGANWNEMLEHCRCRKHLRRLSQVSTPNKDMASESKDFIVCSNNRYECLLCQRVLDRHEIAEHRLDAKHVEKFYAILENSEPGNSPGSRDNSTDSEGYNEAFKNNDIYIEISLGDDDSEVFKCALCDKMGKGLDNLDAHCLTPIHLTHKNLIERVSRTFANSDASDDAADVFMEIEGEGLFYCQACDILIEDEENLLPHSKTKAHVMAGTLRKVLNENGGCVSLLTEEPEKCYHCQLCSRSINGDNNIVGHCSSVRHTQLLNMVKMLSENRSIRMI